MDDMKKYKCLEYIDCRHHGPPADEAVDLQDCEVVGLYLSLYNIVVLTSMAEVTTLWLHMGEVCVYVCNSMRCIVVK